MTQKVSLPSGQESMTVVLEKTAIGQVEDNQPHQLSLKSWGAVWFNTRLWSLLSVSAS